jgi:hypothetical protein
MNAALSDVFLMYLPKAICKTYKPICMKQPNTVFLHMFDWFITNYGRTTTEDCKENWQRMAATWHPSKGFEPLAMRLSIKASYASAARYPMDDCDVIDIGLRVIKHCGMYAGEYKNWISRENVVPLIIKMIDSFKEYWADAIALVNQTAVPALQHGYGMTTMDDDPLVAAYNDSLANFGAVFAATQETMKNQANSLVAMKTQLSNIQLCMNVGQQPPSSGYAPAQQQRTFTNHNKHNGGGQGNNRGFPQQPTMNYGGTGGGQQQDMHSSPNPYKRWENWNYCSSHGGDVDDNHTSAMCGKPGPMHNPNATRANIMGGISRRNAQDHLALNFRPHSTKLLPPAATAPSAMSAQCLLSSWRHDLATTNLTCTVWWNATGKHLLPANAHDQAVVSPQPRYDDECQTVPAGRW